MTKKILPTLTLLLLLGPSSGAAQAPALEVVPSVDLAKYAGRWYEIARYPNKFQRDCASSVTATYTVQSDGKIEVRNECREESGNLKASFGKAKVVDPATNAKLKVTFFWPFSGDYWIIALGPDYEYAIVGEPKREYLWILSRRPKMDEALYQELLKKAAAQGFDTSKLVKTPQVG